MSTTRKRKKRAQVKKSTGFGAVATAAIIPNMTEAKDIGLRILGFGGGIAASHYGGNAFDKSVLKLDDTEAPVWKRYVSPIGHIGLGVVAAKYFKHPFLKSLALGIAVGGLAKGVAVVTGKNFFSGFGSPETIDTDYEDVTNGPKVELPPAISIDLPEPGDGEAKPPLMERKPTPAVVAATVAEEVEEEFDTYSIL